MVRQILISLCYNFLNSFAIELIQKFSFLENRLAQLGGLAKRTCYLTINIGFDIRI